MTADTIAFIVAGLLVFLMLAWQTHVPLIIFAVCAGFVLASTWGPDLLVHLGERLPFFTTEVGLATVSLILLLFPPILTASAFRGSMSHRLIQQFVPAFFAALFIAIFVLKLLPLGLRENILGESHILTMLMSFSNWIILVAIVVGSIELLSQHDMLKARSSRKKSKKD